MEAAESPLSMVDRAYEASSTTLSSTLEAVSTSVTNSTALQSTLSSSVLDLAGRLILSLFRLIPVLLLWLITFTGISLPTWLFTMFSTSLTFTMNATTLMLIALAFASTVSWVVRYRFLNMYARLPPEPQRKEPEIDLFPDTQEGDSKPGLANYLDEFLSAIKVFGYLERPVFHELTRTMQTRKLIAGETLLLEEEKGFCLVVDGLVQIFVKSGRPIRSPRMDEGERDRGWAYGDDDDEDDEDDDRRRRHGSQGYQLLTEVKNGAPMSSLFSILSLFTEDVRLRHGEDEEGGMASSMSSAGYGHARPSMANGMGMDDTSPRSGHGSPILNGRERSTSERQQEHSSTPSRSDGPGHLPRIPPLSLDPSAPSRGHDRPHGTSTTPEEPSAPLKDRKAKSAHPDVLARATVDTTIAIIPATAFRRLTRVYPRATAHIVQVILTRLQRVTLATGHSYLGLTSEVLETERRMNHYTTYDLPNFLRGGALDRLKEKFQRERERIGPEEGMKGIALHNHGAAHRRRSSGGVRAATATQTNLNPRGRGGLEGNGVLSSGGKSDHDAKGISPGDLLTNFQISKRTVAGGHPMHSPDALPFSHAWPASESPSRGVQSPLGQRSFNPLVTPLGPQDTHLHRKESSDEDGMFRESTLACIFKAIGLTSMNNALCKVGSVEQSPRLVSYDTSRQMAVFNNAFGFIDPYDGSADGDSESLASASLSAYSTLASPTGLSDELKDEIEIVYFPKGAVLVEQGERNPGLYYVIDGFLDVSTPVDDKTAEPNVLGGANVSSSLAPDNMAPLTRTVTGSTLLQSPGPVNSANGARRKREAGRKSLFLIKPGGIAGYIGTISSYRSLIDVRAKSDVYVGFLPRASLERIVEKHPIVLLTMAKRLTTLLPRLILHIDFALEWLQVNAGQVIYHQNDESDAIYIVLNGRLRSILENRDGAMKVVGEYGQGESVGELEVMTESSRPATLHAIRDTEVAKFPKSLFNSLALEHPGITIKISKIIASRMRALVEDPFSEQAKERPGAATSSKVSSTLNLRTVAIVPVTAGVPVVDFGSRLMNALSQIGTPNGVTSLNQAAILNHLGRHAFNRMGKLKLSQYLADLEEKYGMVLYVADTNQNAPWTQTCISQADCILLVGIAEGSTQVGEYERFLVGMKSTARKELVLLHGDRFSPPGLTRKWLRNRMWINGGHHHIQMEYRASAPVHPRAKRFGSALKQRVQVLQAEIQKYTSRRVRQTPLYSSESPFKGDFHRLARRLCGKSVGLVLGGGGARGIAHIGVIRALEEAGIPIDIVGGTSIGAFIGALYARDADVVPMYGRAKKFAGRMGSMWRFALDLTYPSASYTTGHEFNRGIFKTFGDSQIEDFWLEFYCNTTNISKSRSEIHTSGYVWRYVRASMSLAGLLPPLCDEGSMLLDGGYIDNLTVAHMKSLGADVIFAVDVGSLDDNQPQQYGDSLSGLWAFVNRWNPFSSYPNPPTLSEIEARLAYVSSVDALERAKSMPGCLYMRPPIDEYGTLDFAKFDQIYQVGYAFGKEYLAHLRDRGVLPIVEDSEEKKNLRRTMAPRRASI
ncbi:MAG: phosphatidylcholine and lysophosphatidylcholine phospholipase [Piccolia ochrophora]|nr:MAG: phosphatidylcholine and lysophosphatidylcholine phospholipase [Piccolia ochrophora]